MGDKDAIEKQSVKAKKFLEDQKEAAQQLAMMANQLDMQKKQELMMLDQQFNQAKWGNDNLITQKEMELQQQATQMAVQSQQFQLQKQMYEQYAKTGVGAGALNPGLNPMASYVPPPTFAQSPFMGGFPH